MAQTPRIGVVIVTYNCGKVLGDCLRSIATYDDIELVYVAVADNNSVDDTLLIAQAADGLPLTTVQLGRNAGYAAGINAGIASMDLDRLDAVFVMNPDCRLRPDTLAVLAQALKGPHRGIAVPRLLYPDGSLQLSLRRAPTVGRAFAEAVIGGTLAGRIGRLGELVTDEDEYTQAGAAVWATGAAMLISVDAIRSVGLWDESFFLYSEETDFALRAADKGWVLWYEPSAVVTHIGGESRTNTTLATLLIVNKVRLFRRRRGAVAGSAYYSAILLGESARALAGSKVSRAAVKALLSPTRHVQRARDRAQVALPATASGPGASSAAVSAPSAADA